MIKRVTIFTNEYELSKEIAERVTKKLEFAGIEIVKPTELAENDLVIAIGGDGTFLNAVKSLQYREDVRFVGINTGTLGFLLEIDVDKIYEFIQALVYGSYKINKVPVEVACISIDVSDEDFCNTPIDVKMKFLNEVTIREEKGDTMHVNICVKKPISEEECLVSTLEEYSGDGILISTSTGSTAYNMSFGGAIVDRSIETLQITPMAPLNNRCYKNLLNSVVVGGNASILISPGERQRTGFSFKADGEELLSYNVKNITVELGGYIQVLSLGERDYIKIIKEKLLN